MRIAMLTLFILMGLAATAVADAPGDVPMGAADGLLQFDPPQAVSCVAVRVDVPEDKMITGMKWYNGSGSQAFPRILVATGNGFEPPAYDQAVTIAQNVQGQEKAWSEVAFTEPIASQSGTLFIVIEYPANYAPEPGQTVLGVGYANHESQHHYFVSGDGQKWFKVTSRCRVLLDPILADRDPGVEAKSAHRESEPSDAPTKMGLFSAPNPFNPETKIELNLPAAVSGDVRIMDVRGRVVADIHHGALAQGANTFVWQGRDNDGRTVASGVYWVLAQTTDQKLVRKILLVK